MKNEKLLNAGVIFSIFVMSFSFTHPSKPVYNFRGGVLSKSSYRNRKLQILTNVGIYCDKKFMQHCKTSPKYYIYALGEFISMFLKVLSVLSYSQRPQN